LKYNNIMNKFNNVNLYEITFCLTDEDGNILENKDGTPKLYDVKGRLKMLEYLCDGLAEDDLVEIQ
tara:strand:- start:14 stop:211 length:198 start_codon:yes stop_codon:yes gene_type:complete